MARKLDAKKIEEARRKLTRENKNEAEKSRIRETIAKNRRGERKGRGHNAGA